MKLKSYANYKQSGIDWLPLIPEGWTKVKLKHRASFTTGWTPPTGDDASYIGENLWANISDLGTRVINNTAKRISDEAVSKANIEISPKNSLLFSFKLSIGQVSFAGEDMYTNEAIATFQPNQCIDVNYGYYSYPIFIVKNASENIYGAKLLNQDLIKNAVIALPNLSEQLLISKFLNRETAKLDTLIAKQEKLIELLQEKRQAIISHAVTKGLDPNVKMKNSGVEWLGMVPEHWKVRRLKYNQYLLSEKTDRRNKTIGLENIEGWSGKFLDTDTDFDGEGIAFNVGDLLFGKLRPYLAKVYLAEFSGEAVGDFHVMRLKEKMSGKFALYQMLNRDFITIVDSSTYGAKMPRASWDFVGGMLVTCPPKNEQELIAKYLDNTTAKIDLLIEKAQQSIDLAKEHRTALISAAVTGKFDVREYA